MKEREEDGSPSAQRIMLEREGVPLIGDDHVDLTACHWTPHRTPLERFPFK